MSAPKGGEFNLCVPRFPCSSFASKHISSVRRGSRPGLAKVPLGVIISLVCRSQVGLRSAHGCTWRWSLCAASHKYPVGVLSVKSLFHIYVFPSSVCQSYLFLRLSRVHRLVSFSWGCFVPLPPSLSCGSLAYVACHSRFLRLFGVVSLSWVTLCSLSSLCRYVVPWVKLYPLFFLSLLVSSHLVRPLVRPLVCLVRVTCCLLGREELDVR